MTKLSCCILSQKVLSFSVMLMMATALVANGQTDYAAQELARLTDKDPSIRANAAISMGKYADKRAVLPLITALKDQDRLTRTFAAQSLGLIGDRRAVDPLILLLKDSDPLVQGAAAQALGNLNDPRAIAQLLAFASDETVQSSGYAFVALREMSADKSSAAVVGLASPNARVRENAARLLATTKEPAVLAALKRALTDSDAKVRIAAFSSLASLGDPSALQLSLELLHSKDPDGRAVALQALKNLNYEKLLDVLIAALKDPAQLVRVSAVFVLTDLQGPQSVEPLITALDDSDREVQGIAANALAELKDRRAVAPLVAATLRGEGMGIPISSTASALLTFRDPQTIDPMLAALESPEHRSATVAEYLGEMHEARAVEPMVRIINANRGKFGFPVDSYLKALGKMGPTAVPPLMALLNDPDQSTRWSAWEGLAETNDSRALEVMIKAVSDEDSIIDSAAQRYLSASKDPRALAALVEALRHPNPHESPSGFSDASALSEAGAPAVDPLSALLHDADGTIRVNAARALEPINDPRVRALLLAALHERNVAVLAGAYTFYLDLGEPGTEDLVIEALNQFGDEYMSSFMLNCGNVRLEDAARAWSLATYHVPANPFVVGGVLWGRSRLPKPATTRLWPAASSGKA